jgi:hypothetical protein
MTTTSNSLGTAQAISSSFDIAWANPSRVLLADGSFATATFDFPDEGSDWLKVTGFGFSIPAGSTINGVVCTAVLKNDGSFDGGQLSQDFIFQLMYNGNPLNGSGLDDGTRMITSDTVTTPKTCGGVADNWGNALTTAICNHATFGVVFHVDSISADSFPYSYYIDYVKLQVTYSTASGPTAGQKMSLLMGGK